MSIFGRLFGTKGPAEEPFEYNGFRIFAAPMKETGGYRIAARIEKDVGGQTLTHQLIRADTCQSLDQATEASLAKARLFIDQRGDTMF